MYRQLNSPKEVTRRLVFLLYAASVVLFVVEMVAVLGRPGWRELGILLGAFAAAVALRRAGYRWLEFDRLVRSFPCGCARDAVPEAVRAEVEALIDEFRAPATGWVRRAEIRHRLVELEADAPEIIAAYSDDLHDVLAA